MLGRQIAALSHPPISVTELKRASSSRSVEPYEPTTHSSSHSKYGKSLCSVPGCQSRRTLSPLVRLSEGEAPDHSHGVLRNWGGTERNRTTTCMVVKATTNKGQAQRYQANGSHCEIIVKPWRCSDMFQSNSESQPSPQT
ncbi:hypothetical protein TNCV_2578701 [Trichonephila clavipes]|nr:hypothetical protein TNCV_2578701 [Trichonephila clavipes]